MPASGRLSPASTRSRVLFPEPLAPHSRRAPPGAMSNERSLSTRRSPRKAARLVTARPGFGWFMCCQKSAGLHPPARGRAVWVSVRISLTAWQVCPSRSGLCQSRADDVVFPFMLACDLNAVVKPFGISCRKQTWRDAPDRRSDWCRILGVLRHKLIRWSLNAIYPA